AGRRSTVPAPRSRIAAPENTSRTVEIMALEPTGRRVRAGPPSTGPVHRPGEGLAPGRRGGVGWGHGRTPVPAPARPLRRPQPRRGPARRARPRPGPPVRAERQPRRRAGALPALADPPARGVLRPRRAALARRPGQGRPAGLRAAR